MAYSLRVSSSSEQENSPLSDRKVPVPGKGKIEEKKSYLKKEL